MNTTNYAIYNLTTGALKWFMTSEPEHIDNSTPAGCGWLEVDSSLDGQWHVDLDSRTLVAGAIDTRSLAQAKADQWALVKAARDAELNGTFTWDGSVFDADDNSRSQIQGAVVLAQIAASTGQTYTVDWTLYDNTTRTLSGADMVNVGIALGTWYQSVFNKGIALRNAINAATDAASVQAITWA